MSYFLIFLAIVVAAAAALYVVGLQRTPRDAAVFDDGLAAPVPSLPPVLLPTHPGASDVDRVRFSLGLRGYRMDQVDEVLDRLRDELASKDAQLAAYAAATPLPADDAVPRPDAPAPAAAPLPAAPLPDAAAPAAVPLPDVPARAAAPSGDPA